jgi:lipid-binding SYLF domain-containing protein
MTQEGVEAIVKQSFRLLVLTAVIAVAGPGGRLWAQERVAGTLWSAAEVLEALQAVPLKCIPPALLKNAAGVAIIPGVVKVGFVIGGRFGEGVVLVRNPDGSWSNPVFISLTGGSVGWQAGVQSADVVLVFKTRKGLERVLQGKGKLTLGADAAVAAGPVGRQAEADTDVRLQAEIYSYSRSRGLFLGVALDGSAILHNAGANEAFYHRTHPEDIQAAEKLKALLMTMSGPPAPIVVVPQPPVPPPLAPAGSPPPRLVPQAPAAPPPGR